MTSQDRQRILDKIQKCLRLSKSSEPHEAASALRQAQKLMSQYEVSDAELMGHEIKSEQFTSRAPRYKKLPLNYAWMVAIIQKAMGVICVSETGYVNGKERLAFRYFGPSGRAAMAVYAHTVIERALWAAWNKYRKDKPHLANERGARMGFWIGWLMEVEQAVMDFGFNEEERKQTELVKLNHYGEKSLVKNKTNSMKLDQGTAAAGQQAGKAFSLNRPMGVNAKALSHQS